MKNWLLCTVAMASLVGGCASSERLVGRPGLQIVSSQTLPPPTRQDVILQQRSYVIGPLDRVAINVYGLADLSQTVQVDASGQIALPLIGTVEATGKSTVELAAAIATQLRRYVKDPQVTVNADTVNQMITIDGAVQAPGLYPVTGRMTMIKALASAKGVTQFANTNYVIVYRRVNNQDMAAVYDVRAIREGIYADPELFPNDVVIVGESSGRRLFSDILSSGALLTAPLVAILN